MDTNPLDTVTRNVSELPSADRAALEHVLGHPLEQGEQVVIAVVRPGAGSPWTAATARARLIKTLQRAAQHAADTGTTAADADAAVAEAMAAIRPRLP
jgi:hypothetical protein